MKDLKIYYKQNEREPVIDLVFDSEIEDLARKNGLEFSGSGVEIGTGIRDIHFIEKNRKEGVR